MKNIYYFALLCLILGAGFAQAQMSQDVQGSQDFPGVGRYPGSFISGYGRIEYDFYRYPTQALQYPNIKEYERSFGEAEGERTIIVYDVPTSAGESLFKVFRSIENGLAKQGFQTILSCGGENNSCGQNFFYYTFKSYPKPYSKFKDMKRMSQKDTYVYTGSFTEGENRIFIFVIVGRSPSSGYINYAYDILETLKLNTEELVLTVDLMEEKIIEHGTVQLGGLYFDHNASTLTEASLPSLNIIANYLNKHPDKEFLVVGHTDTQGDYGYNQRLSTERAGSVVDRLRPLLKDNNTNQLKPVGIGYAAPLTSNTNEIGRAQNRRVELVLVDP